MPYWAAFWCDVFDCEHLVPLPPAEEAAANVQTSNHDNWRCVWSLITNKQLVWERSVRTDFSAAPSAWARAVSPPPAQWTLANGTRAQGGTRGSRYSHLVSFSWRTWRLFQYMWQWIPRCSFKQKASVASPTHTSPRWPLPTHTFVVWLFVRWPWPFRMNCNRF